MAIKFACDGCQKLMDQAEAKHRGTVIVKQYCDTCVVDVDEFLKSRDEAHTAAAKKYEEDVFLAKNAYYAKHPDGILPDDHAKP